MRPVADNGAMNIRIVDRNEGALNKKKGTKETKMTTITSNDWSYLSDWLSSFKIRSRSHSLGSALQCVTFVLNKYKKLMNFHMFTGRSHFCVILKHWCAASNSHRDVTKSINSVGPAPLILKNMKKE